MPVYVLTYTSHIRVPTTRFRWGREYDYDTIQIQLIHNKTQLVDSNLHLVDRTSYRTNNNTSTTYRILIHIVISIAHTSITLIRYRTINNTTSIQPLLCNISITMLCVQLPKKPFTYLTITSLLKNFGCIL